NDKCKFNKISVAVDWNLNLEIVIAISDSNIEGSKSTLIKRIQQILVNEEKWPLRHVPSGTNKITDALAKMALLNNEVFYMFENPYKN
ncbi:hypothetical protein Godav_028062, partial [Gossypium davidsonii]|nr:hypothetical protein [Gossypium davidsonii]